MEDAFPAESEYPAVADAAEEEDDEEEEEEAVAEAPPSSGGRSCCQEAGTTGWLKEPSTRCLHSASRQDDPSGGDLDQATAASSILDWRNTRRPNPSSDKTQETGQAKAGGSGSTSAASYKPG